MCCKIKQGGDIVGKELKCTCGKLLAKIDENGNIKVWCKSCKKEVPLQIERENFIMNRFMRKD